MNEGDGSPGSREAEDDEGGKGSDIVCNPQLAKEAFT
jgi:hypothetical protein